MNNITKACAKEHERAERLAAWLRLAMDRPNSFTLWCDLQKVRGNHPMTLIEKGEPTAAVDQLLQELSKL